MRKPVPTDRELEFLKILWQRGDSTVREICAALDEQGIELAYTTVLSLLQTMESKNLVGHRRVGKAHQYFPKLRRDKTFRDLAHGFLEKVFDGAVDEYVLHVLESRQPSAQELDRLEKLIQAAKSRLKRRGKNRGGK